MAEQNYQSLTGPSGGDALRKDWSVLIRKNDGSFSLLQNMDLRTALHVYQDAWSFGPRTGCSYRPETTVYVDIVGPEGWPRPTKDELLAAGFDARLP